MTVWCATTLAAIALLSEARVAFRVLCPEGNTTYCRGFSKMCVSERSIMYIPLCGNVRVVQVTIAITSYFFD